MRDSAFGVLALFPSADELLKAIPKVREKGFTKLEAYTPYPVHGLREALGVPESKLGILVFLMALLGGTSVFTFEWWTSTISYPILVAGKGAGGWPAWIPVTLEGTILFGTFTAGLGMLFVFNKLPYFGNPVLRSRASSVILRDRFALMIESSGASFDAEAAAAALKAAGGDAIETLPAPDYPKAGFGWWAKTAAAISAACIVAGAATAFAIKVFPTVKPMSEMEVQPRLDAQAPDHFFADGRGMRMPPQGTVPRGDLPVLADDPVEGGNDLVNPLPVSAAVLNRGRHMFDIHCAVCHDALGTGHPRLARAYGAQPADLQSAALRKAPDGYLFWVITKGYAAMPAHGADISPDDRWAIVRYIRALQRSQDAPKRDLK